MEQKTLGNDMDNDIELVEFSVVLVANSNNPAILNPDFLYHNGIVDTDWKVQGDRITTPPFSQVRFKGGLVVQADPTRVIFEQVGNPSAIQNVVCPKMAKRYLQVVPHVLYSAIGINPKGYRTSPAEMPEKVSTALLRKGAWMSFKDVHPDIHLKTTYRYENRMIVLDVFEAKKQEEPGIETPGILFQANIHRDISATNQQKRITLALDILDAWEKDLCDFYTLVEKFNFRSLGS